MAHFVPGLKPATLPTGEIELLGLQDTAMSELKKDLSSKRRIHVQVREINEVAVGRLVFFKSGYPTVVVSRQLFTRPKQLNP